MKSHLPIQATLEKSQTYVTQQLMAGAARPYGDGWLQAHNFSNSPEQLNTLLEGITRQFSATDARFAPIYLAGLHGSTLAQIGIVTILTQGRLPDLSSAQVKLRYHPGGHVEALYFGAATVYALPTDAESSHPDVIALPDLERLLEQLRLMIEDQLFALVAALHDRVKLGKRSLWLATADQIAVRVMHVCKQLGRREQAARLVDSLLNAEGSAFKGKTAVVHIQAGGRKDEFVQRSACCFIDRTRYAGQPVQRCLTCPANGIEQIKRNRVQYLGG